MNKFRQISLRIILPSVLFIAFIPLQGSFLFLEYEQNQKKIEVIAEQEINEIVGLLQIGLSHTRMKYDEAQAQNVVSTTALNKNISFADHHAYTNKDFKQFESSIPLIMTEKDAVKCTTFSQKNWWYLPIDGNLPNSFIQPFLEQLKQIKESKC